MKTIIIYESTHHGNTKKLVDAICGRYQVEAADISSAEALDLSAFERIGLASGIAFGKFYGAMERFAAERLPEGKQVFFLYTCGKDTGKYANSVRRSAESRGCTVLGTYGCLGYDTFGPFKLVGGISKGHPTQVEIDGAVNFFGSLEKA